MRSYNQFCPIAKAAELFCERWTALIIRDLAGGATRFSELQRGVPLASPTLLSQRLKQLEAENVVERRKTEGVSGWTYHLTRAGEEFVPVVMALGEWGQRWSRRDLVDNEVDLGLLLWALEKDARAEIFGARRTIIEMELPDQPEHKRRWWFLNENGHCELCLKPPDRDVQIFVSVTLPDIIRVWRGDISLAEAIDSGKLDIHAGKSLRKAFCNWLAIAPIAHIGSQRETPKPEA